ncbi:MAG: GAF domain-containing sensor histidine kinase [Elainella sp. Prado103]|jgi:hypothetical protein|nr:GAF domain-containing sensor histidine kinase [Elainella sp. Prado103]
MGLSVMIPDETVLCNLKQSSPSTQALPQLQTLESLGLLESDSVPIFEEATQTAAHFLNAPICVLGILDRDRVWFKSAVGLSRIGLMNSLAASRQLPRQEAFCAQVAESQRVLMITDASADPNFAPLQLVQRYGIRSYLGVPLFATDGQCIGSLAVMGLAPRSFSDQEMAFLELIARWCMSEFERERLQKQTYLPTSIASLVSSANSSPAQSLTPSAVKATLLSQMTQELCTPLTSILGMAKVLNQRIYGELSEKQQEYIQIIHNSGQYLVSLVNEIMELGALNDQDLDLNLAPVDIEMLCQQAIATLTQVAQRRDQQLQLTVEPGNRIWLLDKDKVRQMVYHLVFGVIQDSSTDSVIRIHISRKQNTLQISAWASHPWLGEGLPQIPLATQQALNPWGGSDACLSDWQPGSAAPPSGASTATLQPEDTRQQLGLMLSRQLAELHAGDIIVQGSSEEGYRYVLRLPQIKNGQEAALRHI